MQRLTGKVAMVCSAEVVPDLRFVGLGKGLGASGCVAPADNFRVIGAVFQCSEATMFAWFR